MGRRGDLIEFEGVAMRCRHWERALKMPRDLLRSRLKVLGWPVGRALREPPLRASDEERRAHEERLSSFISERRSYRTARALRQRRQQAALLAGDELGPAEPRTLLVIGSVPVLRSPTANPIILGASYRHWLRAEHMVEQHLVQSWQRLIFAHEDDDATPWT